MAYKGYLLKVGDFEFPHKLIRAETYNATMSVQDLDSYRDANGLLHRTALEHTVNKVEFELIPLLTNRDISALFGNLKRNFTVAAERKALVTCYVPELDEYVTQEMYMPDTQFPIYGTYDNEIKYNQIRLAFIGY